jgi:hypothetical protein
MWLLWWSLYSQDAVDDSGLGAALAASRSGVRTGRPPLRSGFHVLEREGEGAKICGADVLVSKSPRCDMADVGCLWASWLGEAL